jgi:hypothetical protein
VLAITTLACVKLIFAALLPLSGDESLYWLYSRHLAFGFIDHPFMNPLMIRIGTTLFGNTAFGVRAMAVLLGLVATLPVWRSAELLFNSRDAGRTAAIFFNLSTALLVGGLAATSDTVVIFTSAFVLYSLVKIGKTGNGRWWIAAGVAFGLGMCAKYTTAFLAIGIILWLATAPGMRRWFLSPWAWAGGLIASGLFAPVLLWNAAHGWASFAYQASRMTIEQFTPRYFLELVGSQLLLLTPPVFALAWATMIKPGKSRQDRTAWLLLVSLIGPIAIYFSWHSLHERVQGNWPEAAYPAICVAAAWAVHAAGKSGWQAWCNRLAAPWSLSIAALGLLQGAFGVLPLGKSDPTARVLAVDWGELAPQIESIRENAGTPAIVTTDYTLLGWLTFYLPRQTPIIQLNERIRWIDAPQPAKELLAAPLLYVCRDECAYLPDVRRAFASVESVGTLTRSRNGAQIGTYSFYRLLKPTQPVLDPVYPPMKIYGARDE